jgi:BirA family biotin operon repressor/biotin-[acetyl-CoA-carboxylase] ligase
MKITYLEKIDSTQKYLIDLVKTNQINEDVCIFTTYQTNGIGSRNNSWTGIKGNLFFSFCIDVDSLPTDLKIESTSIYFTTILRTIFTNLNSKVFMKWPNDFYINNKKIGGTITTKIKNKVICGIGINTTCVVNNFGMLDIKINHEKLLNDFFVKLNTKPTWSEILKEFKFDFEKSLDFELIDKNSSLNSDGSISVNNENIYSLR